MVHESPKSSWFRLYLMKYKFCCICTCKYVDLMVVISYLFSCFNVVYKHSYMTYYCHGYSMYLLVTKRIKDARPN